MAKSSFTRLLGTRPIPSHSIVRYWRPEFENEVLKYRGLTSAVGRPRVIAIRMYRITRAYCVYHELTRFSRGPNPSSVDKNNVGISVREIRFILDHFSKWYLQYFWYWLRWRLICNRYDVKSLRLNILCLIFWCFFYFLLKSSIGKGSLFLTRAKFEIVKSSSNNFYQSIRDSCDI